VMAIRKLMQTDQERHAAIQRHPVLGWLEYARWHAAALDAGADHNAKQAAAVALQTAAAEIAARLGGRPAVVSLPPPPPVLYGSDRTRTYQVSFLLRGAAHQQQNQWREALFVYQKLLRAHTEMRVAAATTQHPDDYYSNDVLVQMWKGLATCSYELGAYAASIGAANRALAIDRSVAGVHRCKALSFAGSAGGKLFGTFRRAIGRSSALHESSGSIRSAVGFAKSSNQPQVVPVSLSGWHWIQCRRQNY
jgi:tetratricopeptide (TPR) repeat protein